MPVTADTAGAKMQSLSSDLYSIPKAQIFFKPLGDDFFILLGDSDEVTLEIAVEETDRFTNESGIRTLARSIVTQIDATLALTLVQLSDLNRATALMGELTYETQAAVAAHTQSIVGVVAGGVIYPLDYKNIDAASFVITDGAVVPVLYVEGVNYKLDAAAGYVQILSIPGGADADVEMLYDVEQLLAADKVALIGLANKSDNRGALSIRGTNEIGDRVELYLHDVQLRPSSARAYISESDLAQVEITGRVFRDPTQAAGFELGFERKII